LGEGKRGWEWWTIAAGAGTCVVEVELVVVDYSVDLAVGSVVGFDFAVDFVAVDRFVGHVVEPVVVVVVVVVAVVAVVAVVGAWLHIVVVAVRKLGEDWKSAGEMRKE